MLPAGAERRGGFDWICNVVRFLATIILAAEGALLKFEPAKVPLLFIPAYSFATDWAFVIIGIATIVGLSAEGISKRYGRAWEWELIRFQLNELSDSVFTDEQYKDMGANRVTLFRQKDFHLRFPHLSFSPRWCFRGWWAGWLVQVCRSGHVSQNRRTCFYAPDESDECEGVAGMAWRSRKAILVDNLPAIHGSVGDYKINTYSSRTWVSPRWVKGAVKRSSSESETLPRSMFGMAVEGREGRWGVLVIDSRQTTILDEEN
jgi:hypothetical protein